ncbi:nucleotidyl transferase AbiEii/AbiGii toxin family protein [Hamadaea sp. NPDC051192]|uniref:nucleotidyl transferase AbiEii/AbiGii toxin family protein n=1 Tax=Hamadaea sp. NPDC051192 TaxID=3154940 RepID=UPI00342EB8CC
MANAFEIHLTVGYDLGRAAAVAQRHGAKFAHIMLDRGGQQSQPMITISSTGTLKAQHKLVTRWHRILSKAELYVFRTKVEGAPWNDGVPDTDDEARREPAGRYFEHHVKLLLPDASATRLIELTQLVEPFGARLSRNARRHRDDGRHERFVTQRCFGVGRSGAREQLDALLAALRTRSEEIVEVEAEYVFEDSRLAYDDGWLTEAPHFYNRAYEDAHRHAPEGEVAYPPTYLPVPADGLTVHQRAAFDPALKHYANAYRAGEPRFEDRTVDARWRAARRESAAHVLTLIAASRWADHLVLRGSTTLRAWLGDAAREPGDLDFVVVPADFRANDPSADQMLADIVEAVRADPGPGLHAEQVAAVDIWTYDRVPGRRLTFPFLATDLPRGTVQVDFVFGEPMPVAAQRVHVHGVDVACAPPELALAWKLLWLESDMYPQGKDLLDAALLAEHTTVSLDLVRDVLRTAPSGAGVEPDGFTAASVLRWDVDWENFADEYPGVGGDAREWQERLARALDRSFAG